MTYFKGLLAGLALSSLMASQALSQERYPSYKLLIETVGVGRCLFMEGRLTQEQSADFISQYLNKKGMTGTQVKNLSKMKDFEEQVDGFIRYGGGCKRIVKEVMSK